ncbi:MAG: hypothetical protein HC809_17095 [Gammaproteobacteria bacterium]|nr:hypothetical protein [Gammaproteobacteria bacterium]
MGATYEQTPWTTQRATAFNLERAAACWQRITGVGLSATPIDVARGSRAISSDRLPVIGALKDAGIYVNLAHGSNGTATAPLGAAIIAELLGGTFAPATRAEIAAIAPTRFIERQARRGYRHGARPVA